MATILEKEILRPGNFRDWCGYEFFVTAEEIPLYVSGMNALMAAGHQVCAYPSHGSDDSMQVLGTWQPAEVRSVDGEPRMFARVELMPDLTAEQIEKIKRLQVSGVFVRGYDNGELQLSHAVTRIDIVGAGAVLGLEPFREVSANELAAVGAAFSGGLALVREVKAPGPRAVAAALSAPGLGQFQQQAASAPPDGSSEKGEEKQQMSLKASLMAKLEAYDGGDDDSFKKELSAMLSEGGEAEKKNEMADGGEDGEKREASADDGADEKKSEMSAPGTKRSAAPPADDARIVELERELFESKIEAKVAALSSPLPKAELDKVRRNYETVRAAAGHKAALSIATDHLDALTKGQAQTAKLSGAQAQPRPKQPGEKPADADDGIFQLAAERWSKGSTNGKAPATADAPRGPDTSWLPRQQN